MNYSTPKRVWLGFGGLAAGVTLLTCSDPRGYLTVALLGCVALVLVITAFVYTKHDPASRITALLLIELLTSSGLIPPSSRTIGRYGLEILFCLPAIPVFWRSDLLNRGGFRLYAIYFGWALITVTFSLAPLFSLARLMDTLILFAAISVCALEVKNKNDALRLIRNYLAGCGIVLVLLAIAYVVLPQSLTWHTDEFVDDFGRVVYGDGISRFVGIFTQPNQVGGLMLSTVGPALVYWSAASRRVKIPLALMIVGSIWFAGLADSRSPFVACAVGYFCYIVWKFRFRGLLICAILGLTLIAGSKLISNREYINRGEVTTLTGRTAVWKFAVNAVKQRPILGYGYEVGGAIYKSRYFPLWWGPWDDGPRSSLHNNYLSHAVGVGIPATILWLGIILLPWASLFRQTDDAWDLKPMALLITIPIMTYNLVESSASDCGYSMGLLFVLTWVLAERKRLEGIAAAKAMDAETLVKMPAAVRALQA